MTAAPPVPFVLFQIDRDTTGPLRLAVSERMLDVRRVRGASWGEVLTEQDIAIALARDLRGGDGVQIVSVGDTFAVWSAQLGGYIVGDLRLADAGGEFYIAAASVCRPEEGEAAESGARTIAREVRIDAVRFGAAKEAREAKA